MYATLRIRASYPYNVVFLEFSEFMIGKEKKKIYIYICNFHGRKQVKGASFNSPNIDLQIHFTVL
jgi:hypothetical protein